MNRKRICKCTEGILKKQQDADCEEKTPKNTISMNWKMLTRCHPSTKKQRQRTLPPQQVEPIPPLPSSSPPRMHARTCKAQTTTPTRYRRAVPQKYHRGRSKTKYPLFPIQKAPHGRLRQLTSPFFAPVFLSLPPAWFENERPDAPSRPSCDFCSSSSFSRHGPPLLYFRVLS